MIVGLSDQESALLRDILDSALRDLKEEIYKTDAHDYREQLKRREGLLKSLIGKISPVATSATPA